LKFIGSIKSARLLETTRILSIEQPITFWRKKRLENNDIDEVMARG